MSYSLDATTRFTVRNGLTPVMYNSNDIVDEAHDEAAMQYMEVASGATDLTIPLGGLTTVEAIDLISDQAISLKINGGTVAVGCKSLTLIGCAITALTVSNSSGALANLRIAMAGT